MMGMIWVVLLVALTGSHLGHCSPLRSTPQTYPHDGNSQSRLDGWGSEGWYAAVPALALVITAVVLLLGCTWCYRHKDCKLFTASATHLHDGRRAHPPDSGFSEPVNNNINEDNNNGPISLREMQNIANNNAAAYIVSENEERNRLSRESVVEFEPLPTGIRVADPLEHCADWFGEEDFPRNRLQYLREIGRGWFGRVVEGEIEDGGTTSTVAVKILNQNASLEDKARFLDEAKMYRDVRHENVLAFIAKCLQEDPWILIFELCSMDLQQYLVENRPKMAILNESGVPLRLMCDVSAGLAHLHSRGYLFGTVWSGAVQVRGAAGGARAVLGRPAPAPPPHAPHAPYAATRSASTDVWSLGTLVWEVCAWGASPTTHPPPLPDLPCPYRNHLYQVMQLCWQEEPEARPTAAQVQALINHLLTSQPSRDHACASADFEERWQRLKPNSIPKLDDHVAIVHAPSTSMASHFTASEQELNQHIQDSLSIDMDTAVSRSSSIMSDKDMSVQIKSESLTNLHGSLEDVRNIYLTHNETATLECHQGNISLEDSREKEQDRSDASMDPWLKDIIAGSQDDVSYYKDVSDVIKNLDNILNSEKTSSSESSHQASPSRDNLSLDCKKDYPMQCSMVKSPGITNFQSILDTGFAHSEEGETCEDDDVDRDTIGTLSHSFERHSEVDTTSQHTLENLTPDTPTRDIDVVKDIEAQILVQRDLKYDILVDNKTVKFEHEDTELPNEKIVSSDSEIPRLKELCVASIPSASDKEQLNVRKDCQTSCDSNIKEISTEIRNETKSIVEVGMVSEDTPHEVENKDSLDKIELEQRVEDIVLPITVNEITSSQIEQSELQVEPKRGKEKVIEESQTFVTNIDSDIKKVLHSDLIKVTESPQISPDATKEGSLEELRYLEQQTPEPVQSMSKDESTNLNAIEETEIPTIVIDEVKSPSPDLPSEIVQSIFKDNEVTENESNNANKDNSQEITNEVDVNVITANTTRENLINKNEIQEPVIFEVEGSSDSANIPIKSHAHITSEVSAFLMEERKSALHEADTKNADVTYTVEGETNNESDTIAKPEGISEPQEADIVNVLTNNPPEDLIREIDESIVKVTDVQTSNLDNTIPNITEIKEIVLDNSVIDNNVLEDSVINIQKHEENSNECLLDIEESIHQNVPLISDSDANQQKVALTVNEAEIESQVENKDETSNVLEDTISKSKQKSDETFPVLPKDVSLMSVVSEAHVESPKFEEKLDVPIETEQPAAQENYTAAKINESNEIPSKETEVTKRSLDEPIQIIVENQIPRSDENLLIDVAEQSSDSTVYKDLTNETNEILSDNTVDSNVKKVIKSCLETSTQENDNVCSLDKNDSTEYLDLPSFEIKQVDNFLHMERVFNNYNVEVVSSTPLASDSSVDVNSTVENSVKDETLMSETKVPDYGLGVSVTKLEQKFVPDNLSPFESPTKSHHTDTYDENSSVVLGPFENCSLELFKCVKSSELVDIPKEELLAFSSNFSEMNLATPSPLRDGNFLNEVPDIIHDDLQFDDIQSLSEKQSDPQTDTDSGNSGTEKRISPSTPPNSPGIFLASTSQQKYLVDIDLTPEPVMLAEPDLSLQKEIELNQIELQITSKLAMAENENNLNIEYSGPLTVEGLVSDDEMLLRDSDALPESFLAGNGGSVEDLRENLTLDEECVKALRNELELKLPLAQVASIEPSCEQEWSTELPPPPELILRYPEHGSLLSPIAEETGQQLSAYENDINWNLSTRSESSESYPEPCNNSTDDVTELPTGAQSGTHDHSTYTIQSRDQSKDQSRDPSRDPSRDQSRDPSRVPSQNNTYTLHRDLDIISSREITMSADSLNASPYKKPIHDAETPIDDKTYNKEEEKESLERISQVSPFLLSPTTDTSAPETSDNLDNATGVSTLSKTTLPTDAKLSKPSETQCLSKATSIDSWCSNDTLYNVEENFDDLAMDPDVPDFEQEKDEGNSESTDTLTHNDDEKEASHCSTYIIHDSKSEACETFSPDSITANDNYTYTKVKTENAGTTPSIITKSELNDSTKNSQTKDLAYGTLMSGMPSYSNCTTELASGFDDWKMPQPELVRKSPMIENADLTPPSPTEDKKVDVTSPQLEAEPCMKKMESIDISCLQDNLIDSHNKTDNLESQVLLIHNDSPNYNYRNMAPSVTSTPITDLIDDANVEAIPMRLPEVSTESPEDNSNVLNFQTFLQAAEDRPQDLSSNARHAAGHQDTEVLLEGDSKTLSRNSNRDSLVVSERTPTYSDFENSAVTKPQDESSKDKSSQSMESGIISTEDFQKFQTSVRSRPQDLSSLIDASSLLLKSERKSSELAMGSLQTDYDQSSRSESQANEHSQTSPPNVTNLNESHSLVNFREPNFLINFDADDETEQPHSIIITETTMDAFKESPNRTYDILADVNVVDVNHSYEPHASRFQEHNDFEKLLEHKINGEVDFNGDDHLVDALKVLSPKVETDVQPNNVFLVEVHKESPNTSRSSIKSRKINEVNCNGGSEKFATVSFLSETFEELIESNVDDADAKTEDQTSEEQAPESIKSMESQSSEAIESPKASKSIKDELLEVGELTNGVAEENVMVTTATQDFLQNEKKFCTLDAYLPMLSDIRFTGPATEIMSTSFTQDSPTEPTSPESAEKRDTAADILKEWDSDSESHTSNSSSGEFIWKQRTGESRSNSNSGEQQGSPPAGGSVGSVGSGGSGGSSGDSGSGSEGDEVEFVPSSWDCRAAPAKSSLRSLEQTTPDNKKRVVFKRQKYHCVYEYPREVADIDAHSPAAYLPDLSTYSEWDPSSAEEAELGYGQLFGGPSPLDLYPLRAGIAFGADYDEDFFISSSARPFESLGIMSTTSQFFPGKHIKPSLLERDLSDDITDDFPPPPSPLPATTLMPTRTPSLDFTTPDSGVEDITPGSTTDEDFKKKLPETELTWRPVDSASSSESVSPSSPGGEALGGLRHTRDKLKLDLPPSPHQASPRHSRVFSFVLDKPRRRDDPPPAVPTTPLVMTDDTPIVTTTLPLQKDCEDLPVPEPTFSTFGKSPPKVEPEQKLILTDDVEQDSSEVKEESPKVVEAVKGEGTVLDSGDEDSGIESSSKATLERNKTNVS